MKNTGVFATKEEIDDLKALMSQPYIVIGGIEPRNPVEQCHKYALSHDLPEIPGYYGITKDGEFVVAE